MSYCVVIRKFMVTSSCPLPTGSCVWKHGLTGKCSYDETFALSEPNLPDLAKHTGHRCPLPEEAVIIRDALLRTLKHNLSSK